ncbi:MAG: OadG family protein [Anaerolineaceae bacterium]|nr:OadG family protein [Anaerolineaceae bacterium]
MENLGTSLWITLIGMGIVFIAIILLWGLMSFLVKITQDKNSSVSEVQTNITDGSTNEKELKQKIAAVAVAAVLNSNVLSSYQGDYPAPSAVVSSWQSSFRQNTPLK